MIEKWLVYQLSLLRIISYDILTKSSAALVDDLMQRTTQIVLDPESGNGPKLKEPRQLFHLADFRTEAKYPTHFPVVQSNAPIFSAPPPQEPEVRLVLINFSGFGIM